jgi:hypothetical protein
MVRDDHAARVAGAKVSVFTEGSEAAILSGMKNNKAATEFIERMGLAAEAEGLPRIAARLFAFMLIDGGPRTADDGRQVKTVPRVEISPTIYGLLSADRVPGTGDAFADPRPTIHDPRFHVPTPPAP